MHLNGGRCDGWLLTAEPTTRSRSATTRKTTRPVMGGARPQLHGLRPLLLCHPRPDVPEPHLPAAARTDRTATPRHRRCRRSGTGSRGRASRAATTTTTSRPSALWGAKYLDDRRPFAAVPRRRRRRRPGRRRPHRPRLPRRGQGISNDDHPHADIRAGDELVQNRSTTPSRDGPNWDAHRARRQLRRVGRLLRPRAAAPRRGRRLGRAGLDATPPRASACRAW